MKRSTRTMRDFPKWVVAHELKESSGTEAPAGLGIVAEKLRQPLVVLTGTAGFRSLLSRALSLAGKQVQWLRAVHVKVDGSLECPSEMAQVDKKDIAKAEVVLITELLQLLVTFIGEALTLHLLLEVWPGAPLKGIDFSSKDLQREET